MMMRQQLAARDEAVRRRTLYKAAAHYRIARDLRELIRALEATEHDPSQAIGHQSIGEWIAWAIAQADLIDPLSTGLVGLVDKINSAAK